MAELRCEVVRAQMDDWADGRLRPGRRARLAAHLQGCSGCSAEWRALGEARRLLADLPAEPLPEGFAERLHRRLVVAAATQRRRRVPLWGRVCLPVATGLLGFLVAASVASRSLPRAAIPRSAAATSSALQQSLFSGPPAAMQVQSVAAGSSQRSASNPSATKVDNGPTYALGAANDGPAQELVVRSVPTVALTLVAASPGHIVQRLTDAAAAAGGSVEASPAEQGGGPMSTMDALVPASEGETLVKQALSLGKVVATAGALPQSPPQDAQVRVMITVLAPDSAAALAAVQPVARVRAEIEDGFVWAGERAPWIGGGLLLCLGGFWAVGRRYLPS